MRRFAFLHGLKSPRRGEIIRDLAQLPRRGLFFARINQVHKPPSLNDRPQSILVSSLRYERRLMQQVRPLLCLTHARQGPPSAAGAAIVQRRGQNWKGRDLESTRMSQHEAILTLIGAAVLTAAAGAGVIVHALRLF
jgi:hypothetical protein